MNKVITDKVPDNPSTPSVQLVTFIDTHTSITDNIKNTIGFKTILSPKILIILSPVYDLWLHTFVAKF